MRRTFAIATTLVLSSLHLQAQATGSMLSSYQRAKSLIDSAVTAHGGVAALRAARTARLQLSGWQYHPTQGSRHTPPFDSTAWIIDAIIDLDRDRIFYTRTRGWPGGFAYTDRFVTRGDTSFYMNTRAQTYQQQQYPRADVQFGNLFVAPQWYLLAAYESNNPGARRYLGRLRLPGSGAIVDAIHYTIPPSGNIVIGLDPRTRRLRATMSVAPDVFDGDTEVVTEFLDWRMLDGMLLPAQTVQRRGGHIIGRQRYLAAQPGYQGADSLFSPPAGFSVAPPNPPAEPVKEVANGVWLVGAGSKSLVVEFGDHLVVVDAPTGGSADVITRAATLAPGKPIRFVVPTHHHDDHFSGVRHYAANGATILTTSGNLGYLRRIMTAPVSSLIPARNQAPPKADYRVETVTGGRRIFTDGTRTLEIHQIASPHAEETLIAWIPEEGILFTADLIEATSAGTAARGGNAETTMHLAQFIRQKGWNVRHFLGAHVSLRDPSEFDKLVNLPIIPPGQ